MEIGEPRRTWTIEPLEEPVPDEGATEVGEPIEEPAPLPALEEHLDLLEAVSGWRVWRVDARYRLCSVLHDEVWEPRRPLAAMCEAGHPAPEERCTCGVYAVRRPEQARAYLLGRNSPEAVHRVIGRVALWGQVVECEDGWRAERAYPARLWVPECPEAFEIAFELGRYGVPVELLAAHRPADVVVAALVWRNVARRRSAMGVVPQGRRESR